MQVFNLRPSVDEARRRQYMPVGDQLDAMVKLAAHLREQGMPLPAEVETWVDHCMAVKADNPKPNQDPK